MARARNIKPAFFENEDLMDISFAGRLLFIGLWTLADREGRLEDRIKRIKIQLFPLDDIDVDEELNDLQSFGFIDRYEVDGKKIIQIVNFKKHQSPHHTEKSSDLPDKNGDVVEKARKSNSDKSVKNQNSNNINGEITVSSPLNNESVTCDSPSRTPLNHECGIMNHESVNHEEAAQQVAPTPRKGSRLTDDWVLGEDNYRFAIAKGLNHQDILDEATKFKNYWQSKSGRDATKLSWDKTWQNWILNDLKWNKPKQVKPIIHDDFANKDYGQGVSAL